MWWDAMKSVCLVNGGLVWNGGGRGVVEIMETKGRGCGGCWKVQALGDG